MKFSSQSGVSLFLAIMILSIIMAVSLGLGTFVVFQLKTINQSANSVLALYAADTGEEYYQTLIASGGTIPATIGPTSLANTASYYGRIYCCVAGNAGCLWDLDSVPLQDNPITCPSGITRTNDCPGPCYCTDVAGTYGNTKRALRVFSCPSGLSI